MVSVGWIMDQIEGAAARSDATFTAVYDEQGVPRFVRFEDGTSPDLSAVEYLVTEGTGDGEPRRGPGQVVSIS